MGELFHNWTGYVVLLKKITNNISCSFPPRIGTLVGFPGWHAVYSRLQMRVLVWYVPAWAWHVHRQTVFTWVYIFRRRFTWVYDFREGA